MEVACGLIHELSVLEKGAAADETWFLVWQPLSLSAGTLQ